ncbi:MAG: YesL family protein [Lachnospiraceae bacterium]|nr:YesL family protein [Lachnospiraceae bacterium]
MNIFKFDSPVMQFMGKVADMIILNLLTLVLSIPIVTFGAAYTAKYYVSMKIVRGDEGTLFKPYFKAFKENFRQSTLIWMIQLVILVLLGLDWIWLYGKGFGNVNEIYIVGLAIITGFVLFITATIFPFIARFEMSIKEAYKGAGLFSFLYFIKLVLIAALEVITIIASIWYTAWLPAILLFGTTTAFYFMNLTLIKGFKKLEAKVEKEEAEKPAEVVSEEGEKEEEFESSLGETLVIKPDEHTVKGKLESEKQTFQSLTFKEKVGFIRDYYLLKIVLGVLVGFFALWFVYDAFIAKKEVLYSGGLLLCAVTDEGREYLTNDYFDKIATRKRKQQVNLSEDLTMSLSEGAEIKPDPTQDQNLFAYIVGGYYDYFFIDAKYIDHYMDLDCFKDISAYADKYNIPEEDRYWYVSESAKQEAAEGEEPVADLEAIKLSDEVCEKIGVYSLTGEGVYVALIVNNKPEERDDSFMEYIFR